MLPDERPPLSKGFLAGKEVAADLPISDATFYREHGIAVFRNFPVGKVDVSRAFQDITEGGEFIAGFIGRRPKGL